MTRYLDRLGRFAATRPWRAAGAWVVILTAVAGLAAAFGGPTQENWDVPQAPAHQGLEQLREHLPASGNTSAQVVVHDREGDPVPAGRLADLGERLGRLPHVVSVLPPRVSDDAATALVVVQYDVPVTHRDLMGDIAPLEDAVEPVRAAGLQVELGGELPGTVTGEMKGTGELIGVVAALAILLVMFRSVVAAGLPVVVAVAGLVVGIGGITVLSGLMEVSPTAPTVATMVGLGVGIDYALLLLTRILEYRRDGLGAVESAARASVTAGRSVVLAGSTVLISLLGLRLSGLNTFEAFGFATAITVLAVMVTALLLVPALTALAWRWLEPRGERRARRQSGRRRTPSPRPARAAAGRRAETWARRIADRPVPWLVAAATVMLVLAAPVLDMRTWPQSGGDEPTTSQLRRAHDLVADAFGPGATQPLLVVADREVVGDAGIARLVTDLAARDDVANVSPPVVSPDGAIALVTVETAYADNDARNPELVADLRDALPPGVEVTGTVPLFADIADILATRIWLVIGFVVAISVLLLTVMFRSVVVPVKAALMNLLSVGAAYGVLTAVFQWGWGVELLGIDHTMPVSTWLPILMFTILFGLSMDYEVFLLSRVREDYERTGDPHGSVARGLASTSGVISAAAGIMVLVFLGFVTEAGTIVKMLGFGMAVAIFLDATLVRMVLVPASMSLLGHRNWWLPGWLDRLLPHVDVEGGATPTRPVSAEPVRTPQPA